MMNLNLFNTFAAGLAKSTRREIYITVGEEFGYAEGTLESLHVDCGTVVATMRVESKKTGIPLSELLRGHYQTCNAHNSRYATFSDDATALFDINGVIIDVSIRLIDPNAKTYRVLFSKVDTMKLYFSMQEQLTELADKVKTMESAIKFIVDKNN